MTMNEPNEGTENRSEAEVENPTERIRKPVVPPPQVASEPDDVRNPGKGNKKRDSLQTESPDQSVKETSRPTEVVRKPVAPPPKVTSDPDDVRNPGKGNKKRDALVTDVTDNTPKES